MWEGLGLKTRQPLFTSACTWLPQLQVILLVSHSASGTVTTLAIV